jgi:hypothetical protein
MLFGPPVDATVVDDGTPPFSKRVTVHCDCRRCARTLARYTGGLRLTVARAKLAGVEVRYSAGIFVFDCQNPRCKSSPRSWSYERLARELRGAYDEGRRRFVVT